MAARLALIGFGAIGRELMQHLAPEIASGRVEPVGAVVREPARAASTPPGGFLTIDEAIARAELIVECAGVAAVREHGPAVIAAGRTLLLASIGSLVDPDTCRALEAGPGVLHRTSGAIGGLDLIGAAAQAGGIDHARITTTKSAPSFLQPWMTSDEAHRLRHLTEPETLFDGTPVEAIERFPANVNVAVALASAVRGLGTMAEGLARVRVRVVADPDATASVHLIEASGSSGDYRFEIANRPSPRNPRTSALTAQSLAAEVRALANRDSRA